MSKESKKVYKTRVHPKGEPLIDRAHTVGEEAENGGRRVAPMPTCDEQFRIPRSSRGTGYDSRGKPVELDFE
jgi:hypothetical protein